ncbi:MULTISPECIES: McrB family protein [Vibrio]|uniref:McrB family protein n=1 Tax=Vibrio TaxID=662 RepID=UPI001F2E8BEC|nr:MULTISPECIES: restriction endonuclease [Vibrio]
MQIEEALSKSRMWIDQLVGKELQYITGRNTSVINNVDWDDEGKIFVSRGEGQITIRFERIAAVISKLIKGHPVHVDTILRSGSNDRSVIETIIANFPPVGFMRPSQGRNKSKNKVIQWLCEDVHSLGVIQDISPDEFSALSLSAAHIKNAQLLSKPFLLLAGISGTGKTRFVREQAKTAGQFAETYCLTSVRPDWHEPSDFLGYISRLNGAAEYITTDVLQFIAKAWRAIADSGLTVEVQESEDQGERLVVAGERDELDKVLPYWLCLDEMNLAPVEQYFADYLSVMETREWCWTGDSFTYSCDALLKPATIKEVADKENLRKALGFENSANKNYDELWQLICQYGLGIPFNLLVAGTVNMDETTHGFSRKVIDRALSFDFGEFFPNNIDEFFVEGGRTIAKRLSYPLISHAKLEKFKDVEADNDAEKTKAFFKAINNVLKQTPFELAFRAFNELCLSVIAFSPKTPKELAAVFDDFLMCKVLPRIEGDEDKLVTADNNNVLVALMDVLETELNQIWPTPEVVNLRPDLLQCKEHDPESVLEIPCRSKTKLEWMNKQLNNGFCSFWP